MKIQFLGATETVTGSKYLIKTNGCNVLVDCGLFQGVKALRLRNWDKLPFNPRNIDYFSRNYNLSKKADLCQEA